MSGPAKPFRGPETADEKAERLRHEASARVAKGLPYLIIDTDETGPTEARRQMTEAMDRQSEADHERANAILRKSAADIAALSHVPIWTNVRSITPQKAPKATLADVMRIEALSDFFTDHRQAGWRLRTATANRFCFIELPLNTPAQDQLDLMKKLQAAGLV